MLKRKYVVKDRQEVPRSSHRNSHFAKCIYTLARVEDGKSFQLVLSKSLGWDLGDVLELEEMIVESPHR